MASEKSPSTIQAKRHAIGEQNVKGNAKHQSWSRCFFQDIPYDIRHLIYEQMELPMLSGNDYSGFVLSCRQAKEEIEHAAPKALTTYLNSFTNSFENQVGPIEAEYDYASRSVTLRVDENLELCEERVDGQLEFDTSCAITLINAVQSLLGKQLSKVCIVLGPSTSERQHQVIKEALYTAMDHLSYLIYCRVSGTVPEDEDDDDNLTIRSSQPVRVKEVSIAWTLEHPGQNESDVAIQAPDRTDHFGTKHICSQSTRESLATEYSDEEMADKEAWPRIYLVYNDVLLPCVHPRSGAAGIKISSFWKPWKAEALESLISNAPILQDDSQVENYFCWTSGFGKEIESSIGDPPSREKTFAQSWSSSWSVLR